MDTIKTLDNNTLGKALTATFFKDADGYAQLVARWKAAVNDPDGAMEPDRFALLAYAVLRGKDWRKGFTPVVNENKLKSGSCAVHQGAASALYSWKSGLRRSIFEGLLVDDACERIQALLRPAEARQLLMADGATMDSVPAYAGKPSEAGAQ